MPIYIHPHTCPYAPSYIRIYTYSHPPTHTHTPKRNRLRASEHTFVHRLSRCTQQQYTNFICNHLLFYIIGSNERNLLEENSISILNRRFRVAIFIRTLILCEKCISPRYFMHWPQQLSRQMSKDVMLIVRMIFQQ